MIITEDMDYEYYENYSSNAKHAIYLFSQINNRIAVLPPYDKIFQDQIYTFDDLLNKYRFFFDDGRDELRKDDPITWETVTPNGVGDCNSAGNFYIRLNKFVPTVLEDIEFYDGNMFADLQEMNRETNTIGSKSNDSRIAKLVIEMKSELEKIREQIQNIE